MTTSEADKAPAAVADPAPAQEPEAPGLPDYMTDPDAVLRDLECEWRYGRPPDYSKTRQAFEESNYISTPYRTREHRNLTSD